METTIDEDIRRLIEEEKTRPEESDNNALRRLLGLSYDGSPWDYWRFVPQGLQEASLPHGTKLKMLHNGRTYTAVIDDGSWLLENGMRETTPSGAGKKLATKRGTNELVDALNGWWYWYARRPREATWIQLSELRKIA